MMKPPRFLRDVLLMLVLAGLGALWMRYSVPIAVWAGDPALAPWGMFSGLALYGVALTHFLRRILAPYVDMKKAAMRATDSAEGAGLVFLGMSIMIAALLMMFSGAAKGADVPVLAKTYLPVLRAEQSQYWRDAVAPSVFASQVEQETCISLKHSKCWNPRAELKTAREQGVGLGQITRTAKFDALAELAAANPEALKGWSWDSQRLYDPAFQLRALILKDKQNWTRVVGAASVTDRWAFSLAGYNGGAGGVLSDRRVCAATAGCNQGRWFDNVEHTSRKAKKAAAGYGKSFFEINREYVYNVLVLRRPKYDRYF